MFDLPKPRARQYLLQLVEQGKLTKHADIYEPVAYAMGGD